MMDLETKDKLEKERNEELEASAKLELEEWYLKYHERIASIKAANRAKMNEPDDDESDERVDWQKVAKLCGSPKTLKDTTRMRSVLMKLKETEE